MAADFDPHAGAILIQAYTLGKVVDDIATEPMNQAEWIKLIMRIITDIFSARPG